MHAGDGVQPVLAPDWPCWRAGRAAGRASGIGDLARHDTLWLLCRETEEDALVPPKVRDLVADLERAGFIDRGGKGSHRNFVHPKVSRPITISGALGDDAKQYQVRAVRRAVEESRA